MNKRYFWLVLIALAMPGCLSLDRKQKLGNIPEIYNDAIQDHGPHQNPVIVIPGVLGSQLRDESGQLVWVNDVAKTANPTKADGCRLLALPMEKGVPLARLRDGGEAFDALDRVKFRLGFVPLEKSAYLNIMKTLGVAGYTDESLGRSGEIDYGHDHYTCFQFPYDWRRSCAENAAALGRFIEEKRKVVSRVHRERFGHGLKDVKFDLVAHSMGGLVARYYLRHGTQPLGDSGALPNLNWAGARDVDKVVLVGTPSAGSMKAVSQLLYGFKLVPLGRRYQFPAGVISTMPGPYEVLPRVRHGVVTHSETGANVEMFDPNIWQQYRFGPFSNDQKKVMAWLLPEASSAEREEIIFDHVSKCLRNAERFHRAMDRPAKLPPGLHLSLIAGTSEETDMAAQYFPKEGKVWVTEKGPGDDAVPRYSALLDERQGRGEMAGKKLETPIDWSRVTLLPKDHLGLTQDPVFVNNVLFTLLEE